jgi:hypothetical protein
MLKKNRQQIMLLLGFCLFVSSFYAQKNSLDSKEQKIGILFVGNSLTYTNNLPKLVKQFAKQKGISIKTEMLALANYALVDHLNDGEIQTKIKKENFDFVIVQQGPSSQMEGKKQLLEAGSKLSALCQTQNCELVYFMVWPSLKYYKTFDKVIEHYREAASLNDAILCPVGEIWKAHFDETNSFDYYGPDGFHPSKKGSEKAAKIIVDTLFKANSGYELR